MSIKTYDLVVIGGGPGGYTGAIRAAKLGMKTALIEERDLGGTCLNRGCIPTKTLLHTAEMFKNSKDWASLGLIAEKVELSQEALYKRKEKIVENLKKGVEGLVKANGIDLYSCHGKILSASEVDAGGEVISAKNILIATGTVPTVFADAEEGVFTSDDVLDKPIECNSVVIVGGGVVGVEFAFYYASTGKKVTMVMPEDRVLCRLSRDVSMQVSALLKSMGAQIICSATVLKLQKNCVEIELNGARQQINADAVMALIGRTNNYKDLGLENIGLSSSGNIAVDENMRTAVKGVYACGDVTDGAKLAHYAAAGAIVAVESMLGRSSSVDMDVCPLCIYTTPEITVVGKQESQVENAKVGKFMMGGNGKSVIEGVNKGYIKVIADQNDVLKGAEIFTVRGSDIAGELTMAIEKGMTAHQALSVIRPHPTVMEAVGEAIEDIFGLATHIPPKLKR